MGMMLVRRRKQAASNAAKRPAMAYEVEENIPAPKKAKKAESRKKN